MQLSRPGRRSVPALALSLALSACGGFEVLPPPPFAAHRAEFGDLVHTHGCAPAAVAVLSGYGLSPDLVRSVSFDVDRRSSQDGGSVVTGHRAWVRLADQPGHLVVRFDRFCRFEDAYTEGGARIALP
jgi:hypothetical protein